MRIFDHTDLYRPKKYDRRFVASDDDGWIRSDTVVIDPDFEIRLYEGECGEWIRTTTPYEVVN